MPFRTWCLAVAFGLIALSGQAQEEASETERSAQQQQQPSQTLPVPLQIEVIEDQSEAQTRKRREEEARQREIRDLAAQEGMNAATQSMDRASQRMAEYAFWSTFLVGIGTALIVATLYYTSKAINVGQDTMLNQLRPWIVPDGGAFLEGKRVNIDGTVHEEAIVFYMVWKNTGQSPAVKASLFSGYTLVDRSLETPVPQFGAPEKSAAVLPNASTFQGSWFAIAGPDLHAFKNRTLDIILYGRFHYQESLGSRRPVRVCTATYRCQYDGERSEAGDSVINVKIQPVEPSSMT